MLSALQLGFLLLSWIVVPAQPPAPVPSLSDCAEKHELCVQSCGKQRQNCDRNTPGEQRCVDQQNQCEAACYRAWKKCEEGPK